MFILGLALGGMLGYLYAHKTYAAEYSTETSRHARRTEQLTREVNLTAEQRKQVEVIVADIQADIKKIRATTEPQIDEVRKQGRDRIRAILMDEQKPKFEEFIQKMDEERKRKQQ